MSGKIDRWEYGGYWLSKKSNSENWNRTWFDPKSRQTRRASLGVSDVEEAKARLIDFVNRSCDAEKHSAEQILLATVFQRYALQHAKHLSTNSRITQVTCLERIAELAGGISVAEFKLAKQEEIVRQLKNKGYSAGYIKRIYTAARSALNWAYKNEEIDRLPPPLTLPDSPPRDVVASTDELAALWDAMRTNHLRMFFILALSTGARHSAVLQLTRFQCDFTHRLIDLNPPGRERTKKRRAIVPMTQLAEEWIESVGDGPLVSHFGKPVKSVRKGWNVARDEAGLRSELTPHVLRHTVATWLRMKGVPQSVGEAFGAWSEAKRSTYNHYAKYDPTYFAPVVAALDQLFEEIDQKANTSLKPDDLRVSCVSVDRKSGGRTWFRTTDLYHVKVALYP